MIFHVEAFKDYFNHCPGSGWIERHGVITLIRVISISAPIIVENPLTNSDLLVVHQEFRSSGDVVFFHSSFFL